MKGATDLPLANKFVSVVLISGKCALSDYNISSYIPICDIAIYIISHYYNVQIKNKLIYQIESYCTIIDTYVSQLYIHSGRAGDMFNMQYYIKSEAHSAQTQHRALHSLLPDVFPSFFLFFFLYTWRIRKISIEFKFISSPL